MPMRPGTARTRPRRRNRLTRLFRPFAGFAALAVLALPLSRLSAQQQVPPAPAQAPQSAPAQDTQAAPAQPPQGPAPATPQAFPKPDPANFTATSPTQETVNAFLQASWGYDENRYWQVEEIAKTVVEGISKVVVYVGDKSGKQKPQALQFFVLPDGKHIIAGDSILPFGDKPFADFRSALQQRATGPYKGSASKDLELVEFADFQCPHCKEAQANMEKLAADFPKARIVFQNYPLEKIHPESKRAASYGVCVAKLGGSNAFFQYASAVFEGQDGLGSADGATLTLNSAVTKAGLDPAKIAACAATPETDKEVESSVKLAEDVSVNQTPMLLVNGRQLPVSQIPYDTLKQIILYQAKLDGVTAQ
jgi:protein-disulfide isomerase